MANKTGIALFILASALFTACGGNSSGLKDGYYTAEAAEFDAYGWKEYLSIYVSGGRIILVEYDAYNPSGFVKSWDMDYMRAMNMTDGTYPNAYARQYAAGFLELQETEGIDTITGATHSYRSFIGLADAALKNARRGDGKTARVRFENGESP